MIVKRTFLDIIPDNEDNFLLMFSGVLESIDELAHLQIDKHANSYLFRIAPSIPKYTPILLEEILRFYNMYGIHLDISKSIKTSGGTINFQISL